MSDEQMTTQELLEFASLDALGLLDKEERAAFEAGFRAAPAGVQAQIRREQGRLAEVNDVLPKVDPPAGLRERVLMAVHEAIAVVTGASEREIIARIRPGAWSFRANVTPLWRAACIGFATATIGLLGIVYYMQQGFEQMANSFTDGQLAAEISRELNPKFVDVLLSPTAQHVAFKPAAPASSSEKESKTGEAIVMIDPESRVALLVCRGLPVIDGQYRLVLIDEEQGATATLARFESNGELMSRSFKGFLMDPTKTMKIMSPAGEGGASSALLASAF